MSQHYYILETDDHNTSFDIQTQGGQKIILFDLIRDADGRRLPIPFRRIPHDRMPPEFDQFRRQHGVYIIFDTEMDAPVYVGESHSHRPIHTATRHVQSWNLGPSWNRDEVLFAFIVCSDPLSAMNLQNLIIAEFILNGHELANNTDDRPEEADFDPDAPPF